MATFKLVDNAVVDLARGGGALWIDLTNTDAAQFNTVLIYGGTFDNSNRTVADFLAAGPGGESNNYVRTTLANPAFTAGTAGQPKWDADDLNIEVSGGTCDANYVAIYQEQPGSGDSTRNIVAIGDLGTTAVADGSNLVLQFAAGGIIVADDPNT